MQDFINDSFMVMKNRINSSIPSVMQRILFKTMHSFSKIAFFFKDCILFQSNAFFFKTMHSFSKQCILFKNNTLFLKTTNSF